MYLVSIQTSKKRSAPDEKNCLYNGMSPPDVQAIPQRVIEKNRIMMRLPIQEGLFREFDPFTVAAEMTKDRQSLNEFIDKLCE